MRRQEIPAFPRGELAHSEDWLLPNYGASPHAFPPADPPAPVPRPRPVHFYHLYAGQLGDGWARVAAEHFQALEEAGFTGEVRVGIVGLAHGRQSARNWLDWRWPGWSVAAEADYGFEQVTHQAIHAAAQHLPVNTPVFYAHTKGGWRQSDHQDLWRRCLQEACATNWERCTAKLAEGYDAVGAHYLPVDHKSVGVPMFAGNYWWATAGYLAGLPAIRHRDRYDAEAWVGLGGMRAFDFVPAGWPYHPHDLA